MDIVGYVLDGEFQCVDCCSGIDVEDCDPVFEDSEWASYPHCCICGEQCRGVALTQDGRDYEDAANAEGCDDGDE
jgi:hypothetical protein